MPARAPRTMPPAHGSLGRASGSTIHPGSALGRASGSTIHLSSALGGLVACPRSAHNASGTRVVVNTLPGFFTAPPTAAAAHTRQHFHTHDPPRTHTRVFGSGCSGLGARAGLLRVVWAGRLGGHLGGRRGRGQCSVCFLPCVHFFLSKKKKKKGMVSNCLDSM